MAAYEKTSSPTFKLCQCCVVSVLVENGIKELKFMRVNDLEDRDRVKAIKRKQNCNNEKPDNRSEESITFPPKKKPFCR